MEQVIKNSVNIDQSKNFFVQHNHLIEAKYCLSLQEKKLMCWLASKAKPEDEDFKEHELCIKKFAELIEVKGDHLYKALNNITYKLMQKIITIRSLDEEGFTKVSLLGGVKYLIGHGVIKLSFHPYLKPYMLQLQECFTKITLADIMHLKSVYAIRIYELLKQYEKIGKREISVAELREYCGIDQYKYKKYNDFKKDVILMALREISDKADLIFKFEEIKRSRKIVSIIFYILQNPNYAKNQKSDSTTNQISTLDHEINQRKDYLNEIIKDWGFSRKKAEAMTALVSDNDISNALMAVKNQIKLGTVLNGKGMLCIALRDRWTPDRYKSYKQTKNKSAISIDESKPFKLPSDCMPKLKTF